MRINLKKFRHSRHWSWAQSANQSSMILTNKQKAPENSPFVFMCARVCVCIYCHKKSNRIRVRIRICKINELWIRSFRSAEWVVKLCVCIFIIICTAYFILIRTVDSTLCCVCVCVCTEYMAKLCVRIYGIVNAKLRTKKSVRRKCFLFTTWIINMINIRISEMLLENERVFTKRKYLN